MKLYAQHGSQAGSGERNKVLQGLARGLIQGAILSPKDYDARRIGETLSEIKEQSPTAERLFDPQYYACMVAHEPDGRLGKLLGEDYQAYFTPRRRSYLESEPKLKTEIQNCLQFQSQLDVTAVVSPNIVIRRRFNSIEGLISRNFIRHAKEAWDKVGGRRPLFVTLAMDAEAIQEKEELEEFVQELTVMESRPDGFYLLVNNPTSEIAPELIDHRTLSGWMFINQALHVNGFRVINGYSDILTPFLCAAGGEAGATGWFNSQKVFSMDRFAPSSGGGRRPVLRYLSTKLLNSIRFDELERLRMRFPQVLSGLPTDDFYSEERASEPDGQIEEVLQTWEAISSLGVPIGKGGLAECLKRIFDAEELYAQINLAPGLRLAGRSNNAHLEALDTGIRKFAELAEIKL